VLLQTAAGGVAVRPSLSLTASTNRGRLYYEKLTALLQTVRHRRSYERTSTPLQTLGDSATNGHRRCYKLSAAVAHYCYKRCAAASRPPPSVATATNGHRRCCKLLAAIAQCCETPPTLLCRRRRCNLQVSFSCCSKRRRHCCHDSRCYEPRPSRWQSQLSAGPVSGVVHVQIAESCPPDFARTHEMKRNKESDKVREEEIIWTVHSDRIGWLRTRRIGGFDPRRRSALSKSNVYTLGSFRALLRCNIKNESA
jgi:hypothetical protein